MILLGGIPSETPIRMVADALERESLPYVMLEQRRFMDHRLEVELEGGELRGRLQLEGRSYRLEDFQGLYSRFIDDRALPELEDEPEGSPLRLRCRNFHDAFLRFWEIAPGRVVNRIAPMASNGSKPYQAQLIRQVGFHTPATLVSNDPDAILDFRDRHGRIIYKSTSGVRSIVRELTDEDLARLHQVRWCPTQFQEKVEGQQLRVHAIGGSVFATAIETTATDYRYAHRDGGATRLEARDLPDELAERCLQLAGHLGLAFAGIDLCLTDDGRAICFEVNPSPAFSYYESNTGQPIARAVARYLGHLDGGYLDGGHLDGGHLDG